VRGFGTPAVHLGVTAAFAAVDTFWR
jgi:hypothetical protein